MTKSRFVKLLSLTSVLLVTACTQIGLFALNFPSSNQTDIVQNVPFGPGQWQKLDIYVPKNTSQGKHDVVVFYYGGKWETGRKEDYKFVGQAFADHGFVTVIADYRKYPEVKFPVFIQDSAQSLAWVSDNIEKYGGNESRIHLAGHSAGAHIASLLATDPRYLKAEGKSRSIIYDFAGLAGPYSFVPDEDDLKDMFGPPSNYPQMQATTFVDGKQPPMFLLQGKDDKLVGAVNLDRLKAAIDQKGGCVKTKIYPDIDHISILTALSWVGKNKSAVLSDVVDYFNTDDHDKLCR